jgi:hypothetical protein
VLLPRLAQMDVHVDEPRRNDEVGRHVDDARAIHRQVLANRGHLAVLDADVEVSVTPRLRVHHAATLEHHGSS